MPANRRRLDQGDQTLDRRIRRGSSNDGPATVSECDVQRDLPVVVEGASPAVLVARVA
jgi:hypothetical protein